MLAVLQDAVETYRSSREPRGRRERTLREETAAWFASHDRSWPFAFERLCDVLGLDAGWIRAGLRRQDAAARRRSAA